MPNFGSWIFLSGLFTYYDIIRQKNPWISWDRFQTTFQIEWEKKFYFFKHPTIKKMYLLKEKD